MKELLTDPGTTRYILEKYGIRAKKKYGQNFLIDAGVVEGIVEAAGIGEDDCVLEIGPGIGTMTQLLAQSAGRVVAVEVDRSLEPVLEETVGDLPNVTVLFQDILRTDLTEVMKEYNEGRPMKCVANLPYYITTPVIMELLKEKGCFESITVMIQKEVAERICAGETDKEYGAISLAVQYYASPKITRDVPPSCFIPRPGVYSSVLTMQAYETPPVDAEEELMFALIRAAFNQRRKTLVNALSHGLAYKGMTISKEDAAKALDAMGLPRDIRGEKLSLEQFAGLSKLMKQ